VTDNPDCARAVRMLRNWGQERKYHHELPGYNYRLEEMQAAILRVKLRHLEAWTEERRSHAAKYQLLLKDSAAKTPAEMPYARHVFHIYCARVSGRDELRGALAERGVETGIHYPIPVHLQRAYANLGYRPGDFPFSELAAGEVLSLPMYPELPDTGLERVCALLREISEPARLPIR